MVTAHYLEAEVRRLAAQMHIQQVIIKPFEPQVFLDDVAKAIKDKQLEGSGPKSFPGEFHIGHLRLVSAKLYEKVQELETAKAEFEHAHVHDVHIPEWIAWVPLLLLWLGIGETAKFTLFSIGVFFSIYVALPLGVALLLSAVSGVLLVILAGAARISQLRTTARRHRRADAKLAKRLRRVARGAVATSDPQPADNRTGQNRKPHSQRFIARPAPPTADRLPRTYCNGRAPVGANRRGPPARSHARRTALSRDAFTHQRGRLFGSRPGPRLLLLLAL